MTNKAKANHQVKKKVKRALLKTIMTRQSELEDECGILPRRRSLELLYNPSKHIRRREMTEVLDMHRCRGCGYRFATISLLERHIKVCTQKDRIKELQVMKPTLRGASTLNSLNKRHMCHYCKKNFTYIGGLKKHIFDICSVRKQIKDKNGKLEQSWEDSIVAMLLARDASQEEESYEKATRKRRGRRKNHRWGYGKKKKLTDAAGNEQEKDEAGEEEDEDENEDNESVTSLVSKDSVRTDTSNSNTNNDNDYMNDNDLDDDDDDDSKSGVLVIDIKDEEEDRKSIDFNTEGLADQINGKISPGVIRAHVEHLQHKDSVKQQVPKEKNIRVDNNCVVENLCSTKLNTAPFPSVTNDNSVLTSNNVPCSKPLLNDLQETSPTAVAARALIDLQSSADIIPSPHKNTPVTYSTLKVPDLSARSFRLPMTKQPRKSKSVAEPKATKVKCPTKQKAVPLEEIIAKTPSKFIAASSQGRESPKISPKKTISQTHPVVSSRENSPKSNKKEMLKRKVEEDRVILPIKKTLTRSKSKNASESKVNEVCSLETNKPVVTTSQQAQRDSLKDSAASAGNTTTGRKNSSDNSPIRIKTGSKVKAMTLASPKVTSAAMKLIVPSPGKVSATAGGASIKKATAAAIKTKFGAKQVSTVTTTTVNSTKVVTTVTEKPQVTAAKEKTVIPATTNKTSLVSNKDKAAPPSPTKAVTKKTTGRNSKDVEVCSNNEMLIVTTKTGNKRTTATKVKDVEVNNQNNQETFDKKTPKKVGRGRVVTTAAKSAVEKSQDTKPAPKKTGKRTSSANVTPNPTPPPSPKKNPKRRATRAL